MVNRFRDTGTFTRQEVEIIFGSKSDARIAMELHKNDPDTYRAVRAQAQQMGLVGDSMERYAPTPIADPNAARVFSNEELIARQHFTEADIVQLYKHGGKLSRNLSTLSQPGHEAELAMVKTAAISYGVLPPSSARPAAPKPIAPPAPPAKFKLAPELARRANLPESTEVTLEQFATINKNVLEFERQQRIAAKAAEDAVSNENKN